MVQSIGPQQTYRDVARMAARKAYSAYCKEDPTEYSNNMRIFYNAGMENPAVAKLILHDAIREESTKETDMAAKLLNPALENLKRTPVHSIRGEFQKDDAVMSARLEIARVQLDMMEKDAIAHATEMGNRLKDDTIPLRDEFNKTYNEMYPRTAYMRRRLMEYAVTSTSPTAPKRPIGEKLQIFYPKTYENRIRLAGNDRLGQKGKVSNFKKMFWNVPLIRNMDIKKGLKKLGKSLAKKV